MKFILALFLLVNVCNAENFQKLLLDIQENERINLKKFHLNAGWNSNSGVFIAKGESFFDFKKETFYDDFLNNTKIAQVNAKAVLSKFLNSKMNAKDSISISNNGDVSSEKIRTIFSKSSIRNNFSIFQHGYLDKTNNFYYVHHYMAWGKLFSAKTIRSQTSVKEYLNKTNLKNMSGARIIIDKKGRYFILNFSQFKSSGKDWNDKRASKGIAKKEITSMLKSNIQASSVLGNDGISDKESQKVLQKHVKGIKFLEQKKFTNPISKDKYYVTVLASRINKRGKK